VCSSDLQALTEVLVAQVVVLQEILPLDKVTQVVLVQQIIKEVAVAEQELQVLVQVTAVLD
jgi:hypothetical protein